MTAELKAIASNLNWSEVYDLAETYRNQQQWQNAAIAFQRAIELRPDFFWSYHHLGDVLTQLQQWKQAAISYRRAVQLDPNFFWSCHNLADALTKIKQWQQAVLAYRRAVQLDPSFFWSWHNLADALSKLQNWDEAIASYLQAIQLQPENQLVYQKLGTAFRQRGDLEESIQYYRVQQLSEIGCYVEQNINRYLFSCPLVVTIDELELNEGWDLGLLTPAEIERGYGYSPKAGESRPIGDVHRQILLDFMASDLTNG